MATVFKRGGKKAPKGTPYMISWYDFERERWATVTGYTDKDMSLAMGQRLERESAQRREGWTNSIREHSLKPIDEPLAEYIRHLRAKAADAGYLAQLETRIRRLLREATVTRLFELEAPKIEAALLDLRTSRGFEKRGRLLSASTRNEYAVSICGFCSWAYNNQRIAHDTLAALARVDESKAEVVHPRRALTIDEIVAWLDGAVRRPEVELLTVRTGKDKGKLTAKVRPAILERARRTARQRRHAYVVAIWTGLRRSELVALEWRDVFLDAEVPFLKLRVAATKSRRGDVIPLHAQAVEELLSHRPPNAKPTDRVLHGVPSMKVLKADLAFAGVEYGNAEIGYADLHAQRKTLNTMLASHKVDSRARQAQLRHTDPRLTENTYFDHAVYLGPQAKQLNGVPAIPTGSVGEIPVAAVPATALTRAQLAHETRGSEGHFESSCGTEGSEEDVRNVKLPADEKWADFLRDVTQGHDPASCDTGSLEKRAKGVEPSTFTLAT